MSNEQPWPYGIGAAVFLLRGTGRVNVFRLLYGRVVKMGADRVTVATAEGYKYPRYRQVGIGAYCAVCEAPALAGVDPVPVCPQCWQPATVEPAPLELVERWFKGVRETDRPYLEHAIGRALAEGRTADDGRNDWLAHRRTVPPAVPPLSLETLHACRAYLVEMLAMVDEEIAEARGDGTGLVLPPLWAPPAGDAEPDQSTTDPIAALLRRTLGE